MSTGEQAKIKVMIVESHDAVRRALNTRLRAVQHLNIVGVLDNPEAAIPAASTEKPDVILLGIQNGSDDSLVRVAQIVKRLSEQTVAVIVLAAYGDSMQRDMLKQAGASKYLLKDIDSPRLIAEIEYAI